MEADAGGVCGTGGLTSTEDRYYRR
jgi:hypothetical protein